MDLDKAWTITLLLKQQHNVLFYIKTNLHRFLLMEDQLNFKSYQKLSNMLFKRS